MSTISNERVEFYAKNEPPFGYTGSDINAMARELLALRKERERAEPVAYMIGGHYLMHANDPKVDNYSSAVPLYTAPPATDKVAKTAVCPKCGNTGLADSGGVQPWGEPILIECDCRYTSTTLKTDTTSQQFESLAGKAVGGWIPCSERMPVEKDIVLVVDDGYFVCEAQYREGDFFSAARGNNEFFETICRDVEFWQPLPEPPCK